MQRLEFSGAVRPIYGSLGVKRLSTVPFKVVPLYWRYTVPNLSSFDGILPGKRFL